MHFKPPHEITAGWLFISTNTWSWLTNGNQSILRGTEWRQRLSAALFISCNIRTPCCSHTRIDDVSTRFKALRSERPQPMEQKRFLFFKWIKIRVCGGLMRIFTRAGLFQHTSCWFNTCTDQLHKWRWRLDPDDCARECFFRVGHNSDEPSIFYWFESNESTLLSTIKWMQLDEISWIAELRQERQQRSCKFKRKIPYRMRVVATHLKHLEH